MCKKFWKLCGLVLLTAACAIFVLSLFSRTCRIDGTLTRNGMAQDVAADMHLKWLDAALFHKAKGSLTLEDDAGNSLIEYEFSGSVFRTGRDPLNYAAVSAYDPEKNRFIALELYYDDRLEHLSITAESFEFHSLQ